MEKNRLEAFSDGVIAIIISVMVLELHAPQEPSLAAIVKLWPVVLSYILSFAFVAIYWVNHHHMLLAVKSINGAVLWANVHLLFWLSLVPFTTGWMGETEFSLWPVVLYGVNMLAAAIAYTVLQQALIDENGKESPLAIAIGKDWKGKASLAIYCSAIALSFVHPWIGCAGFATVSLIWMVPDRRIERVFKDE